ncbi:MAG: adenylate kinase [Deltaproteobacteria bacterium]|nr:adenylate kinase [Deltaproteobacteria bacterium]
MIIVLLGPPGVGKGTQGALMAEELHISIISTGDLLRDKVKKETDLGKLAKGFMDKGELVPDELIVEMIKERTREKDCKRGFILDGFPRTLSQAKSLENMLEQDNLMINKVFLFNVSKQEIIKRLTGRRICGRCGALYHVYYNPPHKENICDRCGGKLIMRDDDNEETVKNRIEVYKKNTAPLIDFYKKQNKLYTINGVGKVEQIFEEIKSVLKENKWL